MKTTASELAKLPAAEAMTEADALCSGDQDWEEGSTTWTFEDGSVLWVCGTEVEAGFESDDE